MVVKFHCVRVFEQLSQVTGKYIQLFWELHVNVFSKAIAKRCSVNGCMMRLENS